MAYVVTRFPQLSETFVENERMAVEELGVRVLVCSLYRPEADLAGSTSARPGDVRYRPGAGAIAARFLQWAARRPLVTARHLVLALRNRSQTMLQGALWAGWLATEMQRARVEHVHAHFGSDGASAAIPAARLVRCPVTFTIHAREIYVRNRGLDVRIRAADRAITVCEYNVDQMIERFPSLRRDEFDIVYCGVDTSAFHCVDRTEHAGAVVISVGRLVEKKGFDVLIRAIAIMRAASGREVRAQIVGQGPLEGELRALASSLGVADAVDLTGRLSPDEVAARLAEADVFALPCRVDSEGDRDSMPVVLKEAMATCMPVVATSVVGIPELVDDSVGRIVAPEDPEQLAAALCDLLDLPAHVRAQLGRAARRRVEERFDVRREAVRLTAVFDRFSGRNTGE